MKQHKWHKEIKAWADGAEIEWKNEIGEYWDKCDETPMWNEDTQYRIKPQANEPQYLYAWQNNLHEITLTTNPPHPLKEYVNINFKCIGKIKLEPEYE